MEDRDESVVLALEGLLSSGTRHGLDDEGWRALTPIVEASGDAELPLLLRRIRDGEDPPEALLGALEVHRRRLVASLDPPRLRRGLGSSERDARLVELNALAGAPELVRVDADLLVDRLAALSAPLVADPIERSSDVSLLWCLVRTGRIAERRAAVRRLGMLLADGTVGRGDIDERDLVAGLSEVRDPRIAYEVDNALAALPGSAGRGARHRLSRADRLLTRVEEGARRYWTGDALADPLAKLVREELLRVGVWLRRGSDVLASHVAEHLRDLLGRREPAHLADAVGALIPSGDERLVPALARVLPDGPLQARIATARAMARIADPRVHPALLKAYRHATDVVEKTVLGGALGQYGDRRALPFLLERLEEDEPAVWEEAIRSLGDVGASEAAPRLLPVLDSERHALVRAAAQALMRCGGRGALETLREKVRTRHAHATVLADAAEAIALRLQVSGELPPGEEAAPLRLTRKGSEEEEPETRLERRPPDLLARLRSVGLFLWGLLWAALLQRDRAMDAFSAAARQNPAAASPHLRQAALHVANSRDDLAIEAYRRALEANRSWVLGRARWVERLGRAYLRRADHLVARRRRREALALLDELAALDLRRVDLDLRLAVARRRDRLLVERARRRLTTA